MATKNKTEENDHSVAAFLKTIPDDKKRSDCTVIIELVTKHTGLEPKMWGSAIVGFGSYHYVYDSGREGDAPLFALAARANAVTLYFDTNFSTRESLLTKFGKHTSSKACVYIKKLEDIDTGILIKLVKDSIAHTRKQYPA